MAARASFSNDSRIVKVPLPKSMLLKDYLLDDLSSCSSNGFRSYPRRQCFTTVRYLIEIDLNKHIKQPPTQKQFLKTKSKPKQKSKSSTVLQKASAVVVNVFKNFQFSGLEKRRKTNFLPRNLSRKLSKHGLWKRTTDLRNKEFIKLNSFNEPIKEKENILHPSSKAATAVTTATVELKTSTSNSSVSSLDSYFSPTSDSSTAGSSSKIIVSQNDMEESDQHVKEKEETTNGKKADVATNHSVATANGNTENEQQSEGKDQFSPISVMDFPCKKDTDDEDEVTSPFQHGHFYVEGSKRKHMAKDQRIKSLAQLKPVRLEDRITLLESRCTHESSQFQISPREFGLEVDQTEKKATALLQQLKATLSSHSPFESMITENILLGFFMERIIEGNISNFTMLQEAKDWIKGQQVQEMFGSQMTKLTYIRDMEKKVKWSKYDNGVETREIGLELEYEVYTSLIHEMLLDFCF